MEGDREVAAGGGDLRPRPGPDLGAVLVAGDVVHPVPAVLDAPVAAQQHEEVGRGCPLRRQAGDGVAGLALQLAGARVRLAASGAVQGGKRRGDGGEQRRLVRVDGQEVILVPGHHPATDVAPGAPGIAGDRPPHQRHPLQHRADGRQLLPLARARRLPEDGPWWAEAATRWAPGTASPWMPRSAFRRGRRMVAVAAATEDDPPWEEAPWEEVPVPIPPPRRPPPTLRPRRQRRQGRLQSQAMATTTEATTASPRAKRSSSFR